METNIFGYLSQPLQPISRKAPFTGVDGLVFALFSYIPTGPDIRFYDAHVMLDPMGLTVGEFSDLLITNPHHDILTSRFGKSTMGEYGQNLNFLKLLSVNERFRHVKITNYAFDNTGYCQFSAYTFELCADEHIISYRGTDGTYEGWYENFRMLNEDIPSQLKAVSYFHDELQARKGSFRLIGHSKGGHLAMTAAITATIKQKLRIRSIYSYDAPGFTKEFVKKNHKNILLIQHKAFSFAAENAIVSCLLYGQNELFLERHCYYVKPNGMQGVVQQHFGYTWLVENGSFAVTCQSKFSKDFHLKILEVSNLYTPEMVIEIYDEVFEAFTKDGAAKNKNITVFALVSIILAGYKKLQARAT